MCFCMFGCVCVSCVCVWLCVCVVVGGKTTLEAQKVQEYVDECFQFAQADQTQGVYNISY